MVLREDAQKPIPSTMLDQMTESDEALSTSFQVTWINTSVIFHTKAQLYDGGFLVIGPFGF